MRSITRERPKMDRIACPWFIRHFVDRDAEFIYVPKEKVFGKAEEPFPIFSWIPLFHQNPVMKKPAEYYCWHSVSWWQWCVYRSLFSSGTNTRDYVNSTSLNTNQKAINPRFQSY
ncbi:MAG: chromate resistance protein ChrB domain-containing protein [Chryseosolibacter sp.]